MKSYYDLIKDNVIDFEKTLLEKYYELGLTETECLVLLRLHQYKLNGSSELNSTEIVKKLSISTDEFGEVVMHLINKDFVSIVYDSEKSDLETFYLDGTYRQLGYVFEGNDKDDNEKMIAISMKQTLQVLENKLNKILTPLEVSIVKKWFYDYHYDMAIINEEIEKVLGRKVKSVNIIDRALFARSKDNSTDEEAKKAKELFDKLYGNN
ncbi:MAG: DnaD domain protein [Bacilli bacterium]|nr:DnaD domain protein [Bacilli bacterium]